MIFRKLVALSGLALVCSILISSSLALAEEPKPASLEEQLKAEYQLVKLGPDSRIVTEPGTVLKVVMDTHVTSLDKVVVVAPHLALCPFKFENGRLRNASLLCAMKLMGVSNADWRQLERGERVYPAKIEVDQKKDKITMQIVECDSCNGVTEPSSFKAAIVFKFEKGKLKTANAPQIMNTISQVLAIDPTGGDEPQYQNSQHLVDQAPTNAVVMPQIQAQAPTPPVTPTVLAPVVVPQGRPTYQIQADIERQQRDIAQTEHSLSLMSNPVARTGMQSLLARQRARLRDLQLELARATH